MNHHSQGLAVTGLEACIDAAIVAVLSEQDNVPSLETAKKGSEGFFFSLSDWL